MIKAINEDSTECLAWLTEKKIGGIKQNFRCLGCDEPVILRKGLIYAHHFAHEKRSTCTYSNMGESDEHFNIKKEIYEDLMNHPKVLSVEMEVDGIEGVRADIGFTIGVWDNSKKLIIPRTVVVEIQRSDISVDVIKNRMKCYGDEDVYVIWVVPKLTTDSDGYYDMKEWEKHLHSQFFGRMYEWVGGAVVRPFHLGKIDRKSKVKYNQTDMERFIELYKKDKMTYYNVSWNMALEDAVDRGLVGIDKHYWTTGHRYRRNPIYSRNVHLAEDFKAVIKNQWDQDPENYPEYKIFIDKMPVFWETIEKDVKVYSQFDGYSVPTYKMVTQRFEVKKT